MPVSEKRELGNAAEDLATSYLAAQGLQVLVRNYQCDMGEVDLICQDAESVVFVEVRYRNQDEFGGSAASVSRSKQRRIIKTAMHYLLAKKLYDKIPCRFDVVAIGPQIDINTLDWIKNAFYA